MRLNLLNTLLEYKNLYMECLNYVGFLMAGFGAAGFFFINTQVSESQVNSNLGGQHHTISTRVSKWWSKNQIDDGDFRVNRPWATRTKVAFWLVDHGSTWCFLLVFCGFLVQLIAQSFALFN